MNHETIKLAAEKLAQAVALRDQAQKAHTEAERAALILEHEANSALTSRDHAAEHLGEIEIEGTPEQIEAARNALEAAEAGINAAPDRTAISRARGRVNALLRRLQEARAEVEAAQADHQAATAAWLGNQAHEAIQAYRAAALSMAQAHGKAVAASLLLNDRTGQILTQLNSLDWRLPDFGGTSQTGWLLAGDSGQHSALILAARERLAGELAKLGKA